MMRRAILLTLALLSAFPALLGTLLPRVAFAQAKAPADAPSKAPEKAPDPPTEKPAPPATPAPLLFTADLIDGIKLIGQPIDLTTLPLKTEFANLQIPLTLIASAAFNKERTHLQVRLKNGDLITGVLELQRIRLRTAYGEASVPVAKLASITAKAGP